MCPHLFPITEVHWRPVITDKCPTTRHLLPTVLSPRWAFIENVLLRAQAFGEMSRCQCLSLVMTGNINARPRGPFLSTCGVSCGWRAGCWGVRTRPSAGPSVQELSGKSGSPPSLCWAVGCPLCQHKQALTLGRVISPLCCPFTRLVLFLFLMFFSSHCNAL